MIYPTKRVIAGSVVAATLAVVTLLPNTGWIVRQQVQATVAGTTSLARREAVDDQILARQEKAATEKSTDFPFQMALAMRKVSGAPGAMDMTGKVTALKGLEDRFPSEPALQAAILRELCRGTSPLTNRKDQDELEPPRKETERISRATETPVNPVLQADWRHAAETGAKLDPDNAFFPMMQAIGLFAENRDAEALAAIRYAGTRARYDDYMRPVATGAWELAEAGQNDQIPVISRTALSAAILLPQYAVLRAMARVTVVGAVHLELAGKAEEGFAVRQALARCGARMRTDSNWIIGNLVGTAIASIAQSRPGGAPALSRDPKMPSEERTQLRLKQYEDYLGRIGHPEEIAWVEHEVTARKDLRSIVNKGLDKGPASLASLMSIMGLWGAGIALLGNTLWMVLFGALATGLSRTERIRNGKPLSRSVAWGLGLSVAPVAGVAVAGGTDILSPVGGLGFLAAALLFGVVIAPHLLQRRQAAKAEVKGEESGTPPTRLQFPVLLGTIAVVTGMAALLFWIGGSLGTYTSYTNGILGYKPSSTDPEGVIVRLVSMALTVGLPVLTGIVLIIASRVRRVPVSVGMVRGFARAALPMTACLSLFYVVVVGVTSVREAAGREGLARNVAHEGRACADVVGREWPTFGP
jgi:hypothetical protein